MDTVDLSKIDKPFFTEIGHKYFNHKRKKSYTSVTTLIHKFEPKKDWKAIAEAFLAKRTRQQVFKDVADKYKFNYELVENIFRTKGYSAETLMYFWNQKKEKSCEDGTAEHKLRELKTLSIKIHTLKDGSILPLGIDATYIGNLFDLPDGVYTELLIWCNKLLISGQSDKVLIKSVNGTRYVYIEDYKTNEEIKDYNYIHKKTGEKVINEMMLGPLSCYCNCNYWHYQIQLNIYAWLLCQFGFKFGGGKIIHCRNGETEYPLLNLQSKITELMEYIKQN